MTKCLLRVRHDSEAPHADLLRNPTFLISHSSTQPMGPLPAPIARPQTLKIHDRTVGARWICLVASGSGIKGLEVSLGALHSRPITQASRLNLLISPEATVVSRGASRSRMSRTPPVFWNGAKRIQDCKRCFDNAGPRSIVDQPIVTPPLNQAL
jgi:hypothetical protein